MTLIVYMSGIPPAGMGAVSEDPMRLLGLTGVWRIMATLCKDTPNFVLVDCCSACDKGKRGGGKPLMAVCWIFFFFVRWKDSLSPGCSHQ